MTIVTIVGNVARDPELRFGSNGGNAFAKFSVAVNRRKKKGDDYEELTSFFDVLCFGEQAENVASCITKGTRVVVTGQLDIEDWETKDGKKGRTVQITADEVAPSLRYATANIEKNARNDAPRFQPSQERRTARPQPEYDMEPF
jgi:single-strand DNA-binding protein